MTTIGLFGIGLDTYWSQFDGLLKNLNSHQKLICEKLSRPGFTIVDAGMVDNPVKAQDAAELFTSKGVELIFLYVSTYALSSTVLPVVQKARVPVIILNLQPVAAIDYFAFNKLADRGKMTGIWLEHCQACSLPEISNVFNQAEIQYDIVTGHLNDEQAWSEISEWLEAAKVKSALRKNRMGILGHYYGGMLDVYTDLTRQSIVFGTHFEMLEMCELNKFRKESIDSELKNKINEFNASFEIVPECSEEELLRAARTSVALDKLVEKHDLQSLAYYYEGIDANEYENIASSVIAGNTILTGKNIPVAGECEVKNAQAMKILAEFNAGGTFSEFYLMDLEQDIVFLGHDGPAHPLIASGNVKLVPLPVFHGKPGKGLSIQMSVKHGPVTLLSVVQGKNGIFLLTAEAQSVPGPVLEIGNTNSRYKFKISAKEFIRNWSVQGPAHHCAIGLGHLTSRLKKLAKLIGIEIVPVC